MDTVKYPLTYLSDNELFDRLGEEASEVIHAIFKLKRFGDQPSPVSGRTAMDMIRNEIADLRTCLAEVERRGIA